MKAKTSYSNYRKIWVDANGPIPKDEDGRSYDIHHIDGDRTNNSLENLMCVSIQEHYDIHYEQGDWAACQAILIRMENTESIREEIRESASKAQIQRIKEKRHNFQLMGPERRREISKKVHQNRNVAFLGIDDPVENSRNARLSMSREMELKLAAAMVDKVRGTKWWNNGISNKRSVEKPGEEWVPGMLPFQTTENYGKTKNTKWWTNKTTKEHKRSIECPGPEWKQGMK